MARVDSQRAIGAVTRLLRDHLIRRGFDVSVGKPEQATAADTTAKLNLFLYEMDFDGSLRNHRLDGEGPPPLWLVLRYLLTAFDDQEQSDSPAAHELLGQGLVALHELNFLRLDSAVANSVRLALQDNPEPLKITFEESTPDLLSKLMQGPDETFRLSTAVQVRPVMLLLAELPRYSLLVGVDYTADPITEIGEEGIGIDVLPTLGARIDRIEPSVFEPGDAVTIFGSDLHLGALEVMLGNEPLQVVGQRSDRLSVVIESSRPGPGGAGRIAAGLGPSAGELPLKLREPRPGGRYRSSKLITGALRPVVDTVALNAGDLVIDGMLLGSAADDAIVALFADGAVVRTFDTVATTADQTRLTVPGVQAAPGIAGTYRVILKVNGMQARMSPEVLVP
jgi:hypothetical protein